MGATVTVAIPVKDGAATLGRTLQAVAAQRPPLDTSIEVMICDSGSRDDSVQIAHAHGAEVIQIAPEAFSHGGTRNLLMERSAGAHVAFLTQDAVPVADDWLATLLGAFALAPDVALAFGPYLPNEHASPMVARELSAWFHSFSPDGEPRIDRLAPDERSIPTRALLGPRGYFTDADGMVARAAWESVPYRQIAYAEDHALAHDMLRAGYAKVYLPRASVLHSHQYSTLGWLRRSYAEARALHALYGYVEPADPRTLALKLRGLVGADLRWAAERDAQRSPGLAARSCAHHAARLSGSLLGTRATATAERLRRMRNIRR